MQTLIIVAHPDLDGSATQAFLKESASFTGASWRTVDTVTDADVAGAERVLFQFPLLWYQAPASLSAWLSAWQPRQLRNKELGVVVTIGRPVKDYQPGGAVGVSLAALLSPFQALAATCAARYIPPFVVAQFAYMDQPARRQLLIAYRQYLELPQPQHFADVSDWWLAHLADSPLKAALTQRQGELDGLDQALGGEDNG